MNVTGYKSVQAALFVAQSNSQHTSNIVNFLILLSQQRFWLPNNPFEFFSLFDSQLKSFTRLENLFVFFRYYNLSLSTNFQFKIEGGIFPISHFIIDPKFLFSQINSLKRELCFSTKLFTLIQPIC
uniref:Uncharacterized protein n=1 Tax=Rhizophagus irregularis (strain DAOM 181602 / DAOM 197198 / MUCL 43194) TaxID=747089 RepID=U9U2N1_RHIID